MDLITDLPESHGYNAILTIVDQGCSKATKFIPCTTEISAEGVAERYFRHLVPWFGLPHRVISDRDPRFTSHFAKELCRLMGIEQNISTAYHPQTDGQTERMNLWLEQYLRLWVANEQERWSEFLTLAEFTHNTWPHEKTGYSSHQLLLGYQPKVRFQKSPSDVPRVEERLEQLHEARYNATRLHEAAKEYEPKVTFAEGTQVWLEGKNLNTYHPTSKLAPRRHGPFQIVKRVGKVAYQLKLPEQWQIHNVFHVNLLSPYKETEQHGSNFKRPPPDLVEGLEEWEIDQVIDTRTFGRNKK